MKIYNLNKEYVEIIEIETEQDIELKYLFNNIDRYDYIYISIGCKKNEDFFIVNGEKYQTNSNSQMFPSFLENFKNPLIILIDNYSLEFDDGNKSIIENYIRNNFNPNIFVIDTLIDVNKLTDLIIYFFNILAEYDEQNWMICNYVRFKHESVDKSVGFITVESKFYNMMINNLTNLYLDPLYTKSFDNFYMWQGYTYKNIFYNIITQFSYFIKKEIDFSIYISYFSYEKSYKDIYDYILQDYRRRYKIIDPFIKHSIDITQTPDEDQLTNNSFTINEYIKPYLH